MKNTNTSRYMAVVGLLVALVIAGCGDAEYTKARESVDSNPLNKNLTEEQKDAMAKKMVEAQQKLEEAQKKLSGK